MSIDAFWIILTGCLIATSCALLGCFLLLRKMTMVADAISHAVLPGIVIAYFIAESRNSLPMLTGAAVFGVLTTVLIEFLHKKGRLQEDASIGVSFTWLFAIGVILITYFADSVDLDQDCVLYGEIAYVPLETISLGDGTSLGPKAVWQLAINLVLVSGFILAGYKGLMMTSFDPLMAAATGVSVGLWHYLLMGAVSLTTVFSFEVVGAILVVAFLTGPAATGFLLTTHLPKMLLLAVIAGCLATISGYYLALWFDGSIAGGMSTMIGIEFLTALLFSPSQGLLIKQKTVNRL